MAHKSSNVDDIGKYGLEIEESEERDAYSSVWKEMKEKNLVWGGKSTGGRGIQKIKGCPKSISLDHVTLSFDGLDILDNASLKFNIEHRYGLLGANGVGKSTLLRRIVRGSIPGIPQYFNIHYLQQEVPSVVDISVYEFLVMDSIESEDIVAKNENRIVSLKQEEIECEDMLDKLSDEKDIEELTSRLCEIYEEIELLTSISSSSLPVRKESSSFDWKSSTDSKSFHEHIPTKLLPILKGLGLLSLKYLNSSLSSLSGGWRARCYMAKCLYKIKEGDVVCFDECTNHLDIACIEWLERYIINDLPPVILILVSHDQKFLENCCTDIVEMKNKKLTYFHGTFSNYMLHQEEMMQLQRHRLEKEQYQQRLVQGIIENVRVHGQSSQVSSKKKKLERVGMHSRLDGKKFKLFSWSEISEDALRFPDRIEAIKENRCVRFKFAEPDLVRLRLATPESPLFAIENVNIGWLSSSPSSSTSISSTATTTSNFNKILNDVTMHLNPKSKVAITGNNGQGKSTFIEAVIEAVKGKSLTPVSQQTNISKGSRGGFSVFRAVQKPTTTSFPTNTPTTSTSNTPTTSTTNTPTTSTTSTAPLEFAKAIVQGKVSVHPNLTVGVVSQNHIAALSEFLLESAVAYIISQSKLNGEMNWSEANARAHLGSFGLGDHALCKIGSLSGGQKARLAFASACLGSPQLLILDEPTNHLSMESIEGLAVACRDYGGALVFASHNRYFISLVANQILHIDQGKATLTHC